MQGSGAIRYYENSSSGPNVKRRLEERSYVAACKLPSEKLEISEYSFNRSNLRAFCSARSGGNNYKNTACRSSSQARVQRQVQ